MPRNSVITIEHTHASKAPVSRNLKINAISTKRPNFHCSYALPARSFATARQRFWDKQAIAGEKYHVQFNIDNFNYYMSQLKGKESKIIDYGCGYGRVLSDLKKHGYHQLYGIDNSKEMVNRAKQVLPDVNIIHVNHNKLPFADNYFDACILFNVLTCITRNKEQIALINELQRVLKPEGIIYISDFLLSQDPSSQQGYEKFKSRFGIYGVFPIQRGVWLRDHTLPWIKKLIKNFDMLEFSQTTVNIPESSNQSERFQLVASLNKNVSPSHRVTRSNNKL